MLETIKEYLVGLGFAVDKTSYNDTKKAIDSVSKGLTSFANGAVKAFGQASVAVAAFGVAAAAGTAKFLDGLGNQEIQMEMLSRQLWTTQQQAMAFNATLKAMGANLQQLYLSPTLMKQYQELHQAAMEMQTPSDYTQQVKMVQDVQLQIKQLRLEAYYALQWIGYYFIKYMQGPISKVHDVLQSINTVIVKNMPTWTKKVAEWMASFVQAGIYIAQAIGKVWDWLKKLAGYIPTWAKVVMAALAVFSVSNPFMIFVEAITAIILLLDDFYTYLHGGKSAFGPFWSWLVKVIDKFNEMGKAKDIADSINSAFKDLGDTLNNVAGFAKSLFDAFQKDGVIAGYTDLVQKAAKVTGDFADALTSLGLGIQNLVKLQGGWVKFWEDAANAVKNFEKFELGFLDDLSLLLKAIGEVMQGKWAAAAKDFGNVLSSKSANQILGINPQSFSIGSVHATPNSYIYPSGSSSSKNVTMSVSQTNYISGNSPQGTADAVSQNFNRNIYNLRGAII